ncbi:MAG TPA: hypothetical protein VHO24_18725 [Opitutaceae bacterium]|nr:hypothetical protein [Opitutaceae bacterium]
MKLSKTRWLAVVGTVILALAMGACSRLLPARKGTAHSHQLVIDTRRLPAVALTGCFIPAVFPAETKLPIVFVQKIPANATFTEAKVEVLAKTGEIAVLEPYIENNQVYLKFAVPSVDSFTQYNVLVRVKYDYR